jgi:hypothetical protein
MRSARFNDALNSGVPHFGQKLRRITFPLSAVLTYSLTSPVIWTLSVLKVALIEALPDERYWQSLHQHARATIGGWLHWNRTAPQKHPPVMDFAILVYPSLCCDGKVEMRRSGERSGRTHMGEDETVAFDDLADRHRDRVIQSTRPLRRR